MDMLHQAEPGKRSRVVSSIGVAHGGARRAKKGSHIDLTPASEKQVRFEHEHARIGNVAQPNRAEVTPVEHSTSKEAQNALSLCKQPPALGKRVRANLAPAVRSSTTPQSAPAHLRPAQIYERPASIIYWLPAPIYDRGVCLTSPRAITPGQEPTPLPRVMAHHHSSPVPVFLWLLVLALLRFVLCMAFD